MQCADSLSLRRIVWDDGNSDPNDFNVMHECEVVGRVYRMNSTAKRRGNGHRLAPRPRRREPQNRKVVTRWRHWMLACTLLLENSTMAGQRQVQSPWV
jgi:hypothetical protein